MAKEQKKYLRLFSRIILCCVMCFANVAIKAQISTFPYVEDFETAPSWTASTAPTSSLPATSDWAWGTPNHTYVIQSAGSGNKCWCAGGLTGAFYNNWEQSYVKSPVFNFTGLLYPHIKFKLFYDCEYHFDGGNLQYSLNGGTTWNDVGTVGGTAGSPIPETNDCNTKNWYNYPSITYLNNPAGFVTSKHGWCGNTQAGGTGWDPSSPGTSCVGGNGPGQWITASHCLTGCAGQANVTFRFTFASGFTCNNFDGFAFDSVYISNGVPNVADFTSVCGPGNTLNFTSTFAPCPQTNAWLWNFGDPASAASNTLTTQNASHTFSAPGTYTVVLIAKGGACNPPDTVTKIVRVMGTPVITSTNVLCFGGTNGAATATIAPGVLPVTYAWSPSGGSAASASNLTAGNYTFTATDGTGCQKTAAVTITQPPLIAASVAPTAITCAGAANGTATITATGGVAPLSYTWSPAGGNLTSASGLSPGIYTTTVSDAHACIKTTTFTITQPVAITATLSATNPLCAAPGSATVNASGGTGALTYSWSPAGGTSNTATGLSGGSYSVTVTDANSCAVTATVSLTQSGSFSIAVTSTNVSCFGGTNGSATAVISGTTAPYSYTWSPTGGNSSTASNLPAGTYTISAGDVNGCIGTKTVVIIQPPVIMASGTFTPVTCNGLSNGSATVTASGGVGPLIYAWSPSGGSASTASGLNTGNYTTTVTDQNSCSKTVTFSITQPPAISTTVTVSNSICGNPGSATVTASGGTGAFSYTWSPLGGASNVAPGLSGGNYSVTVTDANSCNYTATTSITQSGNFTIAVTSTNVSCFGGTNGSIAAVITGTTGPFSYTWSPTGGNSNVASGLTAGNYLLSVSNVNGCINTSPAAIIQPPAISAAVSSTNICNGQQATLTSTVTGGSAPYVYDWLPGGSTNPSLVVSPAATTTYTLYVKDTKNCTTTPVVSSVTVSSPVTVQVNGPYTLCSGVTATLTAIAAGGSGTYTYNWLPGNLPAAQINPAVTTSIQYTVTATDGCTSAQATSQINILANPIIHIQASAISGCPKLCSYFYDSTLIAGGNIAAWHWVFSNGQISNIANPYVCFSKSGNYTATLTVATNNGCLAVPGIISNIHVYNVPTADFTCSTFDGDLTDAPFVLTNSSLNYSGIQWVTTLGTYTDNPHNLNYETEGLYPVKLIAVNSFGCKDSVIKNIKVEPLFTFYAPNTFTPNNDKLNEKFIPVGEGWNINTYKLEVFDRWGELIYHSTDVTKGWDGNAKGGSVLAQQDVYVWRVELDDVFRKHHSYIGHITVLR